MSSSSRGDASGRRQRGRLGFFLCWAVVFADIGTSVYYTPGILYGQVGKLAGFFCNADAGGFHPPDAEVC